MLPPPLQSAVSALRRLRGPLGRGGAVIADQGLSSVTNVLLVVLVARVSSPEVFGSFTLVLAAFHFVQGLVRAFVTDPLVIRSSGRTPDQLRADVAAAGTTVLAVGAVVAVVLAVAGAVSRHGAVWWTLAIFLPGLLLADLQRFAAFAALRPRRALAVDATWAAGFVGIALLVPASATAYLGAWAGAATLAGILGQVPNGAPAGRSGTRAWWSRTRRFGSQLALEHLIVNASGQAGVFAIAGVAGAAAAGAVRGVTTLFGPVSVVHQGLQPLVYASHSRSPHRGSGALARLFAGMLVGVTVGAAVVLEFLPDRLGRALLGATWSSAEPLILPYAVYLVGGALVAGSLVRLRLHESQASVRANSVTAVLSFVGVLVGASVGGAPGAVWGVGTATWVMVPFWFVEARRAGASGSVPHGQA